MMFKGAKLNYPVHEKEMLAIIHTLEKWHSDLIGIPISIYTDHKTLENSETQRDLSQRQARWMEFMSQYNCKIVYVKGNLNTVADALSHTVFDADMLSAMAASSGVAPVFLVLGEEAGLLMCAQILVDLATLEILCSVTAIMLSITVNEELLTNIRNNYSVDPWCKHLLDAEFFPHGVHEANGLLYAGSVKGL
jgi:hypothetical protein